MTDAHGFGLDPDMLSGYLDDELDDRERAAVEARLAESAEWRVELEEVRAARLAVRGLGVRDAPDGFWESVYAAVEGAGIDAGAQNDTGTDALTGGVTGEPAAEVVSIGSRRSRRMVVWLGSAAAAVALIAAVVIIPHRSQVTPNVTAVVAQHGAQSSDSGDPISSLAPVGPFAGFRR